MKLTRRRLRSMLEAALKEEKSDFSDYSRAIADAAVKDTTITDANQFKDPEIIMAQFHKLLAAAATSWGNTQIIQELLDDLNSRLTELENVIYSNEELNENTDIPTGRRWKGSN